MASFKSSNGTDTQEKVVSDEYGAMLVEVSNELTQGVVETLCVRYSISAEKTDKIQGSGIRLLRELESQGLLSENNVYTLRKGLQQLNLQKAIKAIDKFLDHSVHTSDHEDIKKMYCMTLTHNHPLEYDLDDLPNSKINVVLVGKTGNGKSATGNTLLGCKKFEEGDDWDSCTETTEIAQYNEKPLLMDVIDTPGLFDTSKGGVKNEATLTEIAKTAMQVSEGVHVFLLVCRTDVRFTDEEIKTVNQIEEKFGPDVFDFVILAFTRGKDLRKSGKSLEDRLISSKTKGDFMKTLKEKVRNRALAIENSECSQPFLHLQQVTLHCAICELLDQNKKKAYTNEILQRVEELRQQENTKRRVEQIITKVVPSFLTKTIMQSSEQELLSMKEHLKISEKQMTDLKLELDSHGEFSFQVEDLERHLVREIEQQMEMVDECLKSYTTQRETDEKNRKQREILETETEIKNLIRNFFLFNIDTLSDEMLELLINDPNQYSKSVLELKQLHTQLQQYSGTFDINKVATKVISDDRNLIQKELENRNKEREQKQIAILKRKEKIVRLKIENHLYTLTIESLDKVKRNEETIPIESFLSGDDPQESKDVFKAMVQRTLDDVLKTELDSILQEKKKEKRRISSEMFVTDLPKILKQKIQDASLNDLENFINGKIPTASDLAINFDHDIIDEQQIQNHILEYFKQEGRLINTLYQRKKEIVRQAQRDDFKYKIAFVLDAHAATHCLPLQKKKLKNLRKAIEKNKKENDLFNSLKTKVTEHMQNDLPDNSLPDAEIDHIIVSAIDRYILVYDTAKEECKKKCFPGTAMVLEKSSGMKSISNVQIGDQVLTVTFEGDVVFQEVYLIAHAESNDVFPYVSIMTDTNKTINLTSDHCLLVGNTKNYKIASKVKVGDVIFIIKDGSVVPDRVASIKQTYQTGAYCPYTINGNIIVDCVAASCFTTTFTPLVSQILLTPVRTLYSILPLPIYQSIFTTTNVTYVAELSRRGKSFIIKSLTWLSKF